MTRPHRQRAEKYLAEADPLGLGLPEGVAIVAALLDVADAIRATAGLDDGPLTPETEEYDR